MKHYLLRSVKYFLALCVLYAVLAYLMIISNGMISPFEYILILFSTWRGYMLVVATLLLSATYPFFGFIKRETEGSIAEHREQIVNAFLVSGFSLVEESDDKMVFSARGIKKLICLWEDRVTVSQVGNMLVIDGIRRAVVGVVIRLEGYLTNYRRTQQ